MYFSCSGILAKLPGDTDSKARASLLLIKSVLFIFSFLPVFFLFYPPGQLCCISLAFYTTCLTIYSYPSLLLLSLVLGLYSLELSFISLLPQSFALYPCFLCNSFIDTDALATA